MGWERYAGNSENIVGIERLGASSPGETVMDKLGFSVENIVDRAKLVLKKV